MKLWNPDGVMNLSDQIANVSLAPIRELVQSMASVPQGLSAKAELPILHGTTVASYHVANRSAIISVSDGKASVGPTLYPASLEFQKVIEIDNTTVMLFAGAAGMATVFAKALRNWVETMERLREEPLSIRAKVNMMSRIARESLPLASANFMVITILATWDVKRGGRIFLIGPDGSSVLKPNFAITGSGQVGEGIILERWREDLTVQEGVELAQHLIRINASKLDSATGGKIQIKVLDANGVTTIDGGWANG